jgi:hypothetical protein
LTATTSKRKSNYERRKIIMSQVSTNLSQSNFGQIGGVNSSSEFNGGDFQMNRVSTGNPIARSGAHTSAKRASINSLVMDPKRHQIGMEHYNNVLIS